MSANWTCNECTELIRPIVLEQVQPDKVLLGTKSPEALLEKVEEWCRSESYTSETLDASELIPVGGIHTTVPEDMMIMQPHKSFSLNLATYALTSLRLPDTSSFRKWLATPEHDPDSDDTMTEDPQMMGDGTDFDAGMGKIRMMLVKLGCRVNLDAPNTVSSKISLKGSCELMSPVVCSWGFDQLHQAIQHWWR